MAIEVSWLIENHIMKWHITGTLSPAEIHLAEIKTLGMMGHVTSRVHFVFDAELLEEMPPLAAYLQHNWILPRDPRLGWTVYVGLKNPVHRLSISVLANLFKIQMEMVNSLPAALDFLYADDDMVLSLSASA